MALIVLRYRKAIPAEVAKIAHQIGQGGHVSFAGISPGEFYDHKVDDDVENVVEDSNESFAAIGYEFVEQDPSTTLEQVARDDIATVLETP